MEKRVLVAVILILSVMWIGGCFDPKPPPPARIYPIAGAEGAPLDFSALTDSQQGEVVELVRRSLEVDDIRKLHVQILRLHVALILRRENCPELQDNELGRKMDTLLVSIFERMSIGTRLLDSMDPRLPFVQYAETVEQLRKLQTELVRDCGTATGVLLKTGCADKKLFKELPEFSRST